MSFSNQEGDKQSETRTATKSWCAETCGGSSNCSTLLWINARMQPMFQGEAGVGRAVARKSTPESPCQSLDLCENRCNRHYLTPPSRSLASYCAGALMIVQIRAL